MVLPSILINIHIKYFLNLLIFLLVKLLSLQLARMYKFSEVWDCVALCAVKKVVHTSFRSSSSS